VSAGSAYDALPYDAQPFPQSHPDRLAAIASVFGMRPAPVRRCRVLELGCAAGGNLIPMAEQLPDSVFLGIDLSARQIEDARATVAELGLGNVELRHQSILDFEADAGVFDYIVCHGVYSWVPDAVQEATLALCARHLAPHGVAFVSYNTYPGWRSRGAVRDMILYHARAFAGPAAQVAQARALLDFLSGAVPAETGAYGRTLQDERARLASCVDSHVFHEYLEEANEPVYFHEFMARAGRHGLQYVGESDVSTMFTTNFPGPIAETLGRIAPDLVRAEQYMDFLRNRAFRQTLLCRADVPLQRVLSPERVTALHVASPAVPLGSGTAFRVPDGPTFTPGHPVVAAAFHHLAGIWRQSVSFDDLHAAACRRAGVAPAARTREILAADLLVGFTANAVELRTQPAEFVTLPTAKPAASGLARAQARGGGKVTNRRHEAVELDDLARRLLSLLDGERDRDGLVEALVEMGAGGALAVAQDGTPVSGGTALRRILGPAFDQAIATLARCALLVA
jgi:cyclopropane fatty-acyl-phospholipid synthase-like methyltransferase